MSGWSSACHSLLSGSMWLCFVPGECLPDPLPVISCSQQVCGCVLCLMNVWLILCLSFLALSEYVVVFCSWWMSGWSSACHSLLSACMQLCFVPEECLADPMSVIPCFQLVCDCFCLCSLFCLTFCFTQTLIVGMIFLCIITLLLNSNCYFPFFRRYFLFLFLLLTNFMFLLSGGLSCYFMLSNFSSNWLSSISLDCKWSNIIWWPFWIAISMSLALLQVVCYSTKVIIILLLLSTIGCLFCY